MRNFIRNILLLSSASFCLVGTSATAQDAGNVSVAQNVTALKPQASGKGSDQVETVTVTANRRSENIQNVGIAITAFDGSALNQQGIYDFQDLTLRVPDFRFGNGVTGGENVITMRGVGSQNTTPGGDSPVTYSVDGLTLQRTTILDPEFYDIGNVEVDEGPQGTLEGRNSVGGAVRVTTNRPTDETSGAVDVSFGDYAAFIMRGWVNASLYSDGDTEVNLRVTGVEDQHKGYITNVSNAPGATHNLDGENLQTLRAQIDFKLNSNVDFLIEGFTLHNDDPVGTKVQFWQTPGRFVGAPFYSSPWVVNNNFPDTANDRLNMAIATLNCNFGWSTLKNIAGYEKSYHDSKNDADGTGLDLGTNGDWLLNQQQVSDEIRLVSNTSVGDPLSWAAGFYYFHANNFEHFAFIDTGLNCSYCAYTFFSYGNLSTESLAPYGQVDYNFQNTGLAIPLTATVGARYTDDKKYGAGTLYYDSFPIVAPYSTHNWGQWTGKGELKWQFNSDLMAYASASRGYLSGGNIIGLQSFYQPESVWSYEVGEKSEWLDKHLQVNVSAFHEDLSNMQVFIQSGASSELQNAGKARVNGVEAQMTAIPIDGLRINLATALTDAKYVQYFSPEGDNRFPSPSVNPSPSDKCLQVAPYSCNWKGNWLNQTPPYTVDLGVEYDFETSIGTITPRIDTFWSGAVYFLPDNYNRQPAYNETDLNINWTDKSGTYSVEGFIKNVGNTTVISNDGLQSGSFGYYLQEPDNYVYYPPRTIGIRFGLKL
jgi:iron complex outermembrane receptor protein